MQEELVTLETAKLLKEKGYNEYSVLVIGDNGKEAVVAFRTNSDLPEGAYSRPTQSFATKWLRESKNLHIEISYMYGDYWIYDILTIPRHDLVGLSDRPLINILPLEAIAYPSLKYMQLITNLRKSFAQVKCSLIPLLKLCLIFVIII
jgi:hypothetical protein